MTSYARRRDENHSVVQDALETLLAGHVTDSSGWQGGFGDLFVSFGGESGPAYCCTVEIKRDSKATYTAAQIRFQNKHPGCWHRVETVEDAEKLARYIREQVRRLA